MQVSKRHGIVFLDKKFGFIYVYELETGAFMYMNRISGDHLSHSRARGDAQEASIKRVKCSVRALTRALLSRTFLDRLTKRTHFQVRLPSKPTCSLSSTSNSSEAISSTKLQISLSTPLMVAYGRPKRLMLSKPHLHFLMVDIRR